MAARQTKRRKTVRRVSSRDDHSAEFRSDKVHTLDREKQERALLGTSKSAVPVDAPRARNAESLALLARATFAMPQARPTSTALPGTGQRVSNAAPPPKLSPDEKSRLAALARQLDARHAVRSATGLALFIRSLKRPVPTGGIVQLFLDAALREGTGAVEFLVQRIQRLANVAARLGEHAARLRQVRDVTTVPDVALPDDTGDGELPVAQGELRVDGHEAARLAVAFERAAAEVEGHRRAAMEQRDQAHAETERVRCDLARLQHELDEKVTRALARA